ncbi:MAG: DUF6538 domain-containing protein [Limimaricola soesokkakensis]|uniref:DUF6538 domain-containing protein n=1 Tax=Limimaricola soesokkakensis TaxID=1343159 RepID=UPI0040597920
MIRSGQGVAHAGVHFCSSCFLKDGIFYFQHRVPPELSRHFTPSKNSQSLKARSAQVAAARAVRAAGQLDDYWYHLRCRDEDLPGTHMLRLGAGGSDGGGVNIDCMSLSDAVVIYLRLKGDGNAPGGSNLAALPSCVP